MTLKYIVGIAVTVIIATAALTTPFWASGSTVSVVYEKQPTLTPAQIIWLAKLMQCESGIKASAINPKDSDNTPSYGILQFKPGTFDYYTTKYAITGDIMDGVSQVAVVQQWIVHGENLKYQFPDCVRKLGAPPNTGTQG